MTAQLRIPLLDLVIILVYLAGILTIGVLATRRMKMTGHLYFLAGRSLGWAVIGAALFASNISTIHLVGLAASGYNDGLVWGNFEWMAVFTLVLLSVVFAPFYFRSKISTLPEFLERRYSPASRSILTNATWQPKPHASRLGSKKAVSCNPGSMPAGSLPP